MLKIFGNWWKGIKGVQLCACSHFSGYATNLFTYRLTYLAPFARAQFLVTLPVTPAGSCILLVSSFFLSSFFLLSFFLLSGNTSFSHTSQHPITTKLGQSVRYCNHYSRTEDGGVRGHDGVTGVKKVIFTKKASSPSDYVSSTRDFCICSSLTPSTKVMVLKNCQGSFGVTGVKSSFSQKRHQVLQIM